MSNIPILGSKTTDPKEQHIRLLICLVCKSIEELPDGNDTLLEIAASRHEDAAGVRHNGHLMKVPLKYWANPEAKKQIIDQIRDGAGGIDDIDKGWYDTKNTFHEDAMTCFNKHMRPTGRCPDWKSDTKILLPKTDEARKDLGLSPVAKQPGPKTYLCQFCPASVYMHQKLRELRGDYA